MTDTLTLTCIALPNGRTPTTVRLSAFFALRLLPDQPTALADERFPGIFSSATNWASIVNATTFEVVLGDGQPMAVGPVAEADPALFNRIFSGATVRPFTFTDLSALPIVSFPVGIVHDLLKGWYGALGAAVGDTLPSVEELRTTFGNGLLEGEQGDIWNREVDIAVGTSLYGFLNRVRHGEIDLAQPSSLDAFRLLALFHYPSAQAVAVPEKPQPGQGQWSSANKVPLPTPAELAEQFDFHRTLSALGGYPLLLRLLGVVVDLEVEAVPTPGPLTVAVAPTWADPGALLGVQTTLVPATTEAEVTADEFRAVSSSGQLAGALLHIAPPVFRLVQVDVDGLALKAIDFARTLHRVPIEAEPGIPGQAEPGEPRRMGVPAPRTGGVALVETGKHAALGTKLVTNKDLDQAIIQGNPLTLTAEDLVRGYRVDVHDLGAGRWRSLCQRAGTYLPTDGGGAVDLAEDEGVIQAGATQAADAKDDVNDQLYVHETTVDWKGWSLVAPRPGRRILPTDAVSDDPIAPGDITDFTNPAPAGIPIQVVFEPVPNSLPRLRFGHSYRLRLRAADLAGNSRPCIEGDLDGGTHDSGETTFRRFEPVPAPALSLVDDGQVHLPGRGESMRRLAIRTRNDQVAKDNDAPDSVTERFVFAPGTTQMAAEVHSMFDIEAAQAGEPTTVALDPSAYATIVAKDGALAETTVPPPQPPPPGAEPVPQPTYAVAAIGDPTPYLPDPLSRRAAARWLDRLDEVLSDIDSVEWYAAQGWPHALPFRVQLEEGDGPATFDAADRLLHAFVPKGEVRILRLSSQFDPADLDLLGVWDWIEDEFTGTDTELKKLRRRVLAGHHWMLSPWRDLELVNAVQQPLGNPVVMELATKRALGMTWAAVPFLAKIHRDSTAKVELYATWNEPSDGLDVDSPSNAVRKARAFAVPVPVKPLSFEALGTLDRREFPPRHEYGDTRYRRVRYHLDASSRYREYFDPAEPAGFSRLSDEFETHVENSARPAPPRVLYAIPTFRWSTTRGGGRQRRGGGLRVYLDRPWFSSGYGELLGVVLPAGGDLDTLRGQVSEWGSDPMWESAPVPAIVLTPDRFPRSRTTPDAVDPPDVAPPEEHPLPGGPFPVTGLTLPGKQSHTVNVAPHDVAWDPDRHLWYSDIEIDIGDAYFPFVRLALARYHPRSVSDAHLSAAVLVDFLQIAPDRTLVVVPSKMTPSTWTVTLSGPTFTKSSATVEPGLNQVLGLGSLGEFVGELFTRSEVTVRVERSNPMEGEDFGWHDEPGAVVSSASPPDLALWHGTVSLPAGVSGARFRLVVVEAENYIADPELEPPKSSIELFRIGERITYVDIVPLGAGGPDYEITPTLSTADPWRDKDREGGPGLMSTPILPSGPKYNEEEKDTDVVSDNEQFAQERSPEKLHEHLEEIREYLRAREAARPVVKTTRTRLGQELDWIEPESQTPDGRIDEPPSDHGSRNLYARDVPDDNASWEQRLAQFELDDDHEARGPEGTVPVLRHRISEILPHGTLQDFLSKHGRPTYLMRLTDQIEVPVPADNSTHVYAFSSQVATCYGGEGNINVWAPYIQWSDELTLGQLSLGRGMGYGFQTVEAGWQKLPNLYGDWKTHLFVYFNTNGYLQQGDYDGGYNQDVTGWVQVSPTIFPGALLSVSSYFGPQVYINLKYQLYQGKWWLRVNGNWIGYYPASLFQFFGLLSQADKLDWYGEVADSSDHTGTTATDMGSGHFPFEGYQKAAYMNQLAIQSSADGMLARYNPGFIKPTNPACYGIDPHFGNTGNWGPYFFWGGSGKSGWCL